MNPILKKLLECLAAFALGCGIFFIIILCYSIRYMLSTGNAFAFALNGIGTDAGEWTLLSTDMLLFICIVGGIIFLLVELVYTIMQGKNK